MKIHNIVLCFVLATHSLAQINLSAVLSDAVSIFTSLTSVLADTTSTTSSSSQTTSSSSIRATSSAASTTLSSSTTSASAASTPTSLSAVQSSASGASAAAASATSNSSKSDGGSNSNILPIVLGCTLGALALAAFIGLCFLCRRRRSRKSRAAAKNRSQSPSDDESDIWSREKHQRQSFKGPTERTRSLGTTDVNSNAPLASRLSHDHQYSGYGPYPDRNSYDQTPYRPAYYNANGYSQEDTLAANSSHPYSPDHVQSHGHNVEPTINGHHGGNALAAGVGGAALGGLAAHAADRHEPRRSGSRSRGVNGVETPYSEDERNALPQATVIPNERRSGSVNRASTKEPWPYVGDQEGASMENTSSRPRSMSRGRDQFMSSEQHNSGSHSMPSGVALAGTAAAGGLVGAAAARGTGNHSPHRKGILKNARSHSANQSISPDEHTSGPHELESFDIPPPKRTSRNRRHSPLGHAAPAAAIGANHSPDQSRRKSWSNNSSDVAPSLPHESSQDSDIPIVPSRSPRRNSVHSNARYSMGNEGTVELPGQYESNRGVTGLVSPTIEPQRGPTENDGLVSPISPSNSQPGTWSKAQAAELGMAPMDSGTKNSSQESTVVGSNAINPSSDSREYSKGQSSGLVTAIQRIFNSPKQSWAAEDTAPNPPPRRSFGDRTLPMSENIYEDNHQIASVPHRKPAPTTTLPRNHDYSQINQNDAMPGSWTNEPTSNREFLPRKSGESGRSLPPTGGRLYERVNSNEDTNVPPVPVPAIPGTSTINHNTQNTGRARTPTRPGYGIGSGDPYDLARVRTDSSMTGTSLMNYVDPTKHNNNNNNGVNKTTNNVLPTSTSASTSRPPRKSTSSSTNDYREPTLAELRQQVAEEDRQRWSSTSRTGRKSFGAGSRKSGEGSRYGDDRELFGDLIPGADGYDHGYGRPYEMIRGRGAGNGPNGVGTAY